MMAEDPQHKSDAPQGASAAEPPAAAGAEESAAGRGRGICAARR